MLVMKKLPIYSLGWLYYFWMVSLSSVAQITTPNFNVQDTREGYYAFTNAQIFVDYQTLVQNATLLIKNGKVISVTAGKNVPNGAVEVDVAGRYIYPAFIDLFSDYGMPDIKRGDNSGDRNQPDNARKGALAWNQALREETEAANLFVIDAGKAENLRKQGFGAVLTHHPDGIARGSGALVSLQSGKETEAVLNEAAARFLSFNKGSSTQNYPSSLMGSIALLRQTYLDADWYQRTYYGGKAQTGKEGKKKEGNSQTQNTNTGQEFNLVLEAWLQHEKLPAFFEVNSWLNVLRADKIGDEFGQQYIIKSAGDEYRRIEAIKATNATLVVPVNFPEAYDVEDPLDAATVTLAEMKHWEMAPANLAFLQNAGVPFAITLSGMKKPDDFIANLRKAIQYGLNESEALKALTQTPAQLLKAEQQIGSLQEGRLANFFISSGPVFDKGQAILETWVNGKRYAAQPTLAKDYRGVYMLNTDGQGDYTLKISGSLEKAAIVVEANGSPLTANGNLNQSLITLKFKPEGATGEVRLSGTWSNNGFKGVGEAPDGQKINWQATFQQASDSNNDDAKATSTADIGKLIYPFAPFGNEQIPLPQTYLIKNSTVWTNESEGILQQADVLVRDGKIAQVGQGLSASGAIEIDGTGKHLTPGIIDEHSHIAAQGGINEGTSASSAEVRIGDVVNSEDINIYRQLAGGVTAVQVLHGSANPIGGQSALIKLRWGKLPEEMKIKEADPFIKFALGENVKQANWGENYTTRFPQTRMGVEQFYVNAFTQAQAYTANNGGGRRDLNKEAIAEILNKKRFITCHSYVQSEINMLMKVGEQFDFKVNTFTHILEGYKLADKMQQHGAAGSSFADWWAYKFEVKDAIPYNAALMQRVGVVTAINSDDAEMGRRLNQEAAKAVKYGGISEEDALKMVTLNPAKMLHWDKFTGSIKTGKDADLVLWSANPLSIYAIVQKTFVDGAIYFDIETQAAKNQYIAQERNRLIQKMLEAKASGSDTQKSSGKRQKLWHCEDRDTYLEHYEE